MAIWTESEIAVLREYYGENGPSWFGWNVVLPTRTMNAIADKAYSLGIRCNRPFVPCHHGEISTDGAERAVAALDETTRLRLADMFRRTDGRTRPLGETMGDDR